MAESLSLSSSRNVIDIFGNTNPLRLGREKVTPSYLEGIKSFATRSLEKGLISDGYMPLQELTDTVDEALHSKEGRADSEMSEQLNILFAMAEKQFVVDDLDGQDIELQVWEDGTVELFLVPTE